MHTFHTQCIDTSFHVFENLYVFENGNILIQGDHALVHLSRGLDEPLPVLPGLRILVGQVGVVSLPQVPEPRAVRTVGAVDRVHDGVDGNVRAGCSQPPPVAVDG